MTTSQRILAAFWISAGLNHFVNPKPYEAIMPSYVPKGLHGPSVFWSGVAEAVGGLAVLREETRNPFARWWLTGILAAVFPANVYMATDPDEIKGLPLQKIPKAALWLRLPLQLAAGWWIWKATALQD